MFVLPPTAPIYHLFLSFFLSSSMSFPVRSHLFNGDSYFCDWRVWVNDCEDSLFFRNAVTVNAAIHLFCTLGYAAIVLYRASA